MVPGDAERSGGLLDDEQVEARVGRHAVHADRHGVVERTWGDGDVSAAFGRQVELAEDHGLSPNENDVEFAEGAPVSAKAPDDAARLPPASIATHAAMAPAPTPAAAGAWMRRITNRMRVMVVASWLVGGFHPPE